MNQLMLHSGSKPADINDLMAVPLPEQTSSYMPVSHAGLAINLMNVAGQNLIGFAYEKSAYGLNKNGNQLFGVHTYRNQFNDELGLSIGFRNSYDKSMSVGIAVGASVFVCDNLTMSGEITVLRKHTLNVHSDLLEMMKTAICKYKDNYHRVVDEARMLSEINFTNHDAFSQLGLLYGKGIITPRQIPVVKSNWLTPKQEAFEPRNAWSFYNAATESLKSCKPNEIMERHIGLHKHLMAEVISA